MQVPRYTYLPLILREIRENLVELALSDEELAQADEKDWWFEEDFEEGPKTFASQGACRWCVSQCWCDSRPLMSLTPRFFMVNAS